MPYAAQSDLVPLRITQAELVQLTCDDASGEANEVVVTAALTEASGKIDSYARERYQTPLQPSATLTGLCVDITVYLLFSRRRNAKLTEVIRQRYDDAIAFLKDISTGKASFDQPASDSPQSSASSAELPQPVIAQSGCGAAPANPQAPGYYNQGRFGGGNIEGFV